MPKVRAVCVRADLTISPMIFAVLYLSPLRLRSVVLFEALKYFTKTSLLIDIDYINAHGTSTEAGDLAESLAIQSVFGAHAPDLAVSSTKSMIGHLLGAAGSVEAILTALALRDNVAPPTINLDNPSPGCELNYVPHQAQERPIQHALSNSFGFGGANLCLVLKRAA